MSVLLFKNSERGSGEYGWLSTRYSFSFADWYDESKMGFGALRVLNDDWIAPHKGFGKHGHRDMEIITIVTNGAVTHEDSMSNRGVVRAGDVQVMSAGTGVLHSEYNNENEPLTLLQLWIQSQVIGSAPSYMQKSFGLSTLINDSIRLVGEGALLIKQKASITFASFDTGRPYAYAIISKGNGAYIFILEGKVSVDGVHASRRDAIGITDVGEVIVEMLENSKFLVIEVPMK